MLFLCDTEVGCPTRRLECETYVDARGIAAVCSGVVKKALFNVHIVAEHYVDDLDRDGGHLLGI